jgi:hypothetical protein
MGTGRSTVKVLHTLLDSGTSRSSSKVFRRVAVSSWQSCPVWLSSPTSDLFGERPLSSMVQGSPHANVLAKLQVRLSLGLGYSSYMLGLNPSSTAFRKGGMSFMPVSSVRTNGRPTVGALVAFCAMGVPIEKAILLITPVLCAANNTSLDFIPSH